MYRGSIYFCYGILFAVFYIAFQFTSISTSYAASYFYTVVQAVESHNKVAAARAGMEATRQRIRVARGDWFPGLEITANSGYEETSKPSVAGTQSDFSEVNLKITQLLWDFGATNTRIEKSRLRMLQSQLTLFKTQQDIMLEAVTAAIRFRSALKVLDFARKSEDNIRRQTGLEQARVDAGGGLSTDVLQAKTQLAGAQARRIQTEGKMAETLNRYRTIFQTAPTNLKGMAVLESVVRELPKSLSRSLKTAIRVNPRIRISSVAETLARATVNEVRQDEFFPKFEVVGKTKIANNVSGVFGRETDASVMLQLRFPFNLGFTSTNSLRASQSEAIASSHRLEDTRLEVEEAVRNAWVQYETARLTAKLLRDQASLANAFLQKARKERKLGNRSLIDVLAGESALFNAKSDAAAMEADVLVASFTLLHATGQLIVPALDQVQSEKNKGKRKYRWKIALN
ncbi:MAG: TolC family outer membrane protein [Rhizobiaceae bacterium]|nr:TolC family outer membrane protein [Rhizobiaceae bacterium]